MKKQGFYSTGEFMRMAHITKKTIRYYDEQNILKPSYVDPDTTISNARESPAPGILLHDWDIIYIPMGDTYMEAGAIA